MIEMKNVSKWYGEFQVLDRCSTFVGKGDVVVICGPSGSGKSTLIKCVNGLEPFQEGTVTVDGISVGDKQTNLPKLRSRIGMVFQNFELFPHITVIQNIALAQVKVLGRSPSEAEDRGMVLLNRVGLADQAAKHPAQLSGGQQQRVAIARALVTDPQLILADEPTGNLDSRTGQAILDLLRRLNVDRELTVLMVTHSTFAATYGHRTVELRDGRIIREVRAAPLPKAQIVPLFPSSGT